MTIANAASVRKLGARRAVVALLSLVIALFELSWVGPVFAQPAAEADSSARKDEARQHFDRGLSLLKRGLFDPALAEFSRSREIFATRAATKNAAICLKELKRYDEALDMFEALLREFHDIPPDERPLIDQEIGQLRPLVGGVVIRAGRAGAVVTIDGRNRGTTPISAPIRVSVGTHLIRVFKQGYAPHEQRFEVTGGENTSVEVNLRALESSGQLAVSEQSGKAAEVVIDNVVVGKAPWSGDLAPGDHVVTLRGAGDLGTQPVAAPVRAGQTTRLTLLLESLDATLRIEPTPANATVALDQVTLGRGLWEGRVRSGSHTIEVAAEGFIASSRRVSLDKPERQTVRVTLERDPTSPLWGASNRSAFVLELRAGPVFSPGLAPAFDDSCNGACDKSLPLGFTGRLSFGYRFAGGLAAWLDAGYLTLRQKYVDRSATLTPRGLNGAIGTASDELELRGFLVGASAGIERGESWSWSARLGGGVFVGTLVDKRSGKFVNDQAPGSPSYTVGPTEESPDARYLYVAPSVSVGYRVAEPLVVGIGVSAIALFALRQPEWTDRNPPLAGNCTGGTTFPDCLGEGEYGKQGVAGKTLIVVSPGIDLRYEFR